MSGCGIIEKQVASEESLKQKASFAIGTQPNNISITNVQSGLEKITFDAEANGSQYSCYYTTAIVVKSDAICRKMNAQADTKLKPATEENQGQCNALLKAAGRCK
ncbi:hypothetical protein [Candidatus Enterovibrio escicola]|uniref:Uncharacterized protein n=1 Tax=Candidatus Enterovibrio escicola TaxID=1927127 RepID=A0A2A5T779_9GAMM|nr:hypothetical protein [Candidatus Enterovibrio escacola]PCS24004.1 hypothetical protein BTN49_0372 [Candidatus Enterovibrio escacola]